MAHLVGIDTIKDGAVLIYETAEPESISLAVRYALQKNGFALEDGTPEDGTYRLVQPGLMRRLIKPYIGINVSIQPVGKSVRVRFADISDIGDDEVARGIRLRNLRKIVSLLRRIEI
ncbi:hypothetical protein DRQ36_04150 [bacterium]|nr:MAG: hypothetical protein DRQ36_04150 [bacterium]